MSKSSLRVLVLRGGPDREREVSLISGGRVAAALREAGHEVRESDILPDDLTALGTFGEWGGDVVFPVLHGHWGEGGPLQRILTERDLPYVGATAPAAELCMDKHLAKLVLEQHGIATPKYELISHAEAPSLPLPFVIKVPDEGSTIGLSICHTESEVDQALPGLRVMSHKLLVEQFIDGYELTVGVIARDPAHPADERGHTAEALPPIHIVPSDSFYDYDAKYTRDDTEYHFDLPGPADVGQTLRDVAYHAYRCLGCRHLARVDFILDGEGQPWCLEVNTMPGFTAHSLLPMAARYAGIEMPALVDRMVRLAVGG